MSEHDLWIIGAALFGVVVGQLLGHWAFKRFHG